MRLAKFVICFISICPCVASGASQGSWSKDSAGGVITVGNQEMRSQRMPPPADVPQNAVVERISWHISLLSRPPPSLKVMLCHSGACRQLSGLSGVLTPYSDWPAKENYQFIYIVKSRGQLRPALHVVRNHITVNYKRK